MIDLFFDVKKSSFMEETGSIEDILDNSNPPRRKA